MDRTAEIRGARLAWREAGSGDVVLFVHAFPLDSRMWAPQLAAAPVGWRFVAPDLQGFGASGVASVGAPLTMDDIADDVAGLLDHLGVQRAVLCGLSMGGYAAFAFWRRHADRVRALVLSDTRVGADTAEARAGRFSLAERVLREGSRAAVEAMFPKMLSPSTVAHRPDVAATVRSIMESAPPSAIVRALYGLAERPDSTATLPTITAPALVIVGEDDAVTPPAEAERIADGIPGARLVRIPAAGHFPNLEAPEAFNGALTQFLETLAPVQG
ncbi:MAG TPA: alpha/beta fold hydrolase [Longimicrobiales bacterium]|nr:alpha/beta fold hydrolase [Longimicrobiales bacterium]